MTRSGPEPFFMIRSGMTRSGIHGSIRSGDLTIVGDMDHIGAAHGTDRISESLFTVIMAIPTDIHTDTILTSTTIAGTMPPVPVREVPPEAVHVPA